VQVSCACLFMRARGVLCVRARAGRAWTGRQPEHRAEELREQQRHSTLAQRLRCAAVVPCLVFVCFETKARLRLPCLSRFAICAR
jgi:hypothetical protein